MSRHTQGKWELMPQGENSGLASIVICISKEEKIYECIETLSYESEEDKANANLMCAAPQLLEAAEALLKDIYDEYDANYKFNLEKFNKHTVKSDDLKCLSVFSSMENAIKKARGL